MKYKKGHIPWNKELTAEDNNRILSGKDNPFYGKQHTDETKKKISDANKGHTPWNKGKHVFVGKNHPMYGKHHTEEAKKKMSDAKKGQPVWNKGLTAEEDNRVLSGEDSPFYGKQHTDETKKKLSQIHKGKHLALGTEFKKGMIPWNKGLTKDDPRVAKMYSFEVIKKRSETLTEYYKTHENPFKGGHHTTETKRKIGDASLECWQDPEHKKKQSMMAQKRWEDPEYVKKVYTNVKPNKLERKFNDILQKYFPNEWKYNGNFSCGVTIGGLIPDFININGRKTVIELFGEYWHTGEIVKNKWKSTEFGRKAIYSQLGYDCVVIWDYELEDISNVIEKITENFGKTA